jgi:hypothetical protein
MLQLKSKTLGKVFNLPQTTEEINFDYLLNCVKDIDVRKHYCIVALVVKCNIRDILDTKKNSAGSARYFIVKRSEDIIEENKFLEVNSRILAPASDMFMGLDVNTRFNELTTFGIQNFINSDKELSMSVARGDLFRSVSTGAVHQLITDKNSSSGKTLTPKLITTIAETAITIGLKLVPESQCIGIVRTEKLPQSGYTSYIADYYPTLENI